jgi:hypothetical protein
MSVKKRVLAKNENLEFVEFACPVPITFLINNKHAAKQIDDLLSEEILNYVKGREHMVYSDHTDPLTRLLVRLVVIGDINKVNFD